MASFMKSIIKEVNTIKSMLDIPALKKQRELLRKRLEEAEKIYTKYNTILDKAVLIKETANTMLELCNICLEGNEFEIDKANVLNVALLKSVEIANNESNRAFAEIQWLEGEIEKINVELNAAREAVR
jgi:hypothetical protein